jgi:hypothetical protein
MPVSGLFVFPNERLLFWKSAHDRRRTFCSMLNTGPNSVAFKFKTNLAFKNSPLEFYIRPAKGVLPSGIQMDVDAMVIGDVDVDISEMRVMLESVQLDPLDVSGRNLAAER